MPTSALADPARPGAVRSQRITAVLILASCAVTVLSAVTWRERQTLRTRTGQLAACERKCDRTRPDPAPHPIPAHIPEPAPLVGPTILDFPLEVVCPGDDIRDTTLGEATSAGVPHLVNLWQLSCSTCLAEFPLLHRALAASGTRFLPIDIFAGGHPTLDYRTAQARHGMPTPTLELVDRDQDDGFLGSLEKFAHDIALPAAAYRILPLSFVLDCDDRLRWWKIGGIEPAETDRLATLLGTLHAEPSCRPDPAPPSVCDGPKPPRKPRRPIRRDLRRADTPESVPDVVPPPTAPAPEPTPAPEPAKPPPTSPPKPKPPAASEPPSFQLKEQCLAAGCAPPKQCSASAHGLYTCKPPDALAG
jgi:hypothetical protein